MARIDGHGLPPGKYATRVVRATWDVIELEYRGPFDPDDPCLFPFTKDADETADIPRQHDKEN